MPADVDGRIRSPALKARLSIVNGSPCWVVLGPRRNCEGFNSFREPASEPWPFLFVSSKQHQSTKEMCCALSMFVRDLPTNNFGANTFDMGCMPSLQKGPFFCHCR